MSRTKGHSFERKIANDFKELGYEYARRHLEYQDGEANGVDIANTEPFLVQCKRKKGYSPVSTLDEIQIPPSDYPYYIPLVITKADQKPDVAILYWDDLMDIISGKRKIINKRGITYDIAL